MEESEREVISGVAPVIITLKQALLVLPQARGDGYTFQELLSCANRVLGVI
jgi:hypothetical protein